ncbi:MAG: serine/threonine-protein kinase [Rubripirellula sp.]
MTALLDKLKWNGNCAKNPAPQDSVDSDTHTAKEGDDSLSSADQDWLGETQLGDSSTVKKMNFTYPPGSTPLPRHTIRRGIGMGGFGEVYFALTDAGKEVALKRIQRNLEVELRGVSQCLNLKHPNLVSLHDICRDDKDQSWVVMEYVAGPNLREVLDQSPQGLADPEVHRWFQGIASGVAHLHSAGLVHRDLKPGNVFDDLGIVKVGDYGLSKFISTSHRGGHTESVGTFHYMAPEIGRGQYGREIDIYALGILLYELLTGEVPFDGESCHEIIVKHLTATPDLQSIKQPYRAAIAKCLEKDPGKRFSNVPELMQAIGMRDSVTPVLTAQVVPTATEVPVQATLLAHQPIKLGDEIEKKQVPSGGAYAPPKSASVEEPFARAIRASFADLNRWWATLDRSPGAKVFLLMVAAFVLLVNTHWLLPLMSFIAVFYVPYYVVRQMVLHVRQQPTYAEAQRLANVAETPRRPMTKQQWRDRMRMDLRAKRSLHRVAELNTSWVAATFTTFGLALAAGIIGLRSGVVDATTLAPYGWVATVVLLASLGILGMGKLWERDEGEALPRRLVLAGLGAGVGAAAYATNEFLMLPIDQGLMRDVDATSLPQAFYRDGVPVASALMAHFALLFALLRWWKPVDPLRRTRLSLWSVAVAVVAEWAVHQVLPIPQPAGMMIAGGICIAIQMSSPWINPRGTRPAKLPSPVPPSTPQATEGGRSMA